MERRVFSPLSWETVKVFCPKLNRKYQAIMLTLNPGTLKIILGPKDIGNLVFCGLVNYNCAVAIEKKPTQLT